jgi:hypothetical protein
MGCKKHTTWGMHKALCPYCEIARLQRIVKAGEEVGRIGRQLAQRHRRTSVTWGRFLDALRTFEEASREKP